MEVVTEEVRARDSAVAVVDAEEGALWPLLLVPAGRLHDIQDYRNPILIVVPHDALVGIGAIALDNSIPFARGLWRLMIRHLAWELVSDKLFSEGSLASLLGFHCPKVAFGEISGLGNMGLGLIGLLSSSLSIGFSLMLSL